MKHFQRIFQLIILSIFFTSIFAFNSFAKNNAKRKCSCTSGFLVDKNKKIDLKKFIEGVRKAESAILQDIFSKDSVWKEEYLNDNEEVKNNISNFISGNYAQNILKIYEPSMTVDKLKEKLKSLGFQKKEPEGRVDDLLGRSKDRLYQDSGEIYVSKDGSMVKIKSYSKSRLQRPQQHYILSVLKNPEGPVTWQNESFKITKNGIPVPKGPRSNHGIKISPPNSSGNSENKGWIEYILEETHINLES